MNPELRLRWISALRRKNFFEPSMSAVLCSVHFRDEDFDRTSSRVRLRSDAISLSLQSFVLLLSWFVIVFRLFEYG